MPTQQTRPPGTRKAQYSTKREEHTEHDDHQRGIGHEGREVTPVPLEADGDSWETGGKEHMGHDRTSHQPLRLTRLESSLKAIKPAS